jgi:dipeptidyl aminopeptidase/acylaminoacyl peptidase
MRRALVATTVLIWATTVSPAAQQARSLAIDDLFNLKTIQDPRISPDGQWVAYTVSQLDAEADRGTADVFMTALDGSTPEAVQLTTADGSERSPRWSPDGRYLGFLASRGEEARSQVWLLDRRGGEASQLTEFETGVSSFEWSPDGTRLAVVVRDPDPEAEAEGEKDDRPEPIIVRRLQFKRDGQGYLTERYSHLHVFDVGTRESTQITDGPQDDGSPVWSPDGQTIAFVSNRTGNADANANTDIFLVPAAGGAVRALTSAPTSDSSPAFSPDGTHVAYLTGGDPADIWYALTDLAVVPVSGGEPRVLTEALDRNVSSPRFAPGGEHVVVLLEDEGRVHLARVALDDGRLERVVEGERAVQTFDLHPDGATVVLASEPTFPGEVFAVQSDLRRLTHANDEFLSGIHLGEVTRFTATSRDGTPVDAFLTMPPGQADGQDLPLLLRIHGGPVSQFASRFSFEWQVLAAHGFAVVGANPRGSSGYGYEFSRAIFADWGNKDFEDVMAAVDALIDRGVADADRLGVGGWSYGGILTNYVITQTDRFKAAISGASEVNYLSNYGTDHYQRQWEAELGLPWENTDLWIRLSPFFKVDRITTPTLIMCGQEDWNVPLLNSEQLYQGLRRLGRETELVIYPGQSHGIRLPSFQKDRYERYVAWYSKYLLDSPASNR